MDSAVEEVNITSDTVEITEKTLPHYNDRDEATVVGTLVSKKEFEKFNTAIVLTTAGRNRDITSLINVKLPKELDISMIPLKSRVEIKGALRFRPIKKDETAARPTYEAYVEAHSFDLKKSAMEEAFGIKGRSFGESYNNVILTGTVSRMIQTNRNSARLTLVVHEAGQKERLVEGVFYARNNMKSILPKIAAGNKVCVIAEIQNYKKDSMKSYTISGKTVVRKEELPSESGKPDYVRNVVFLDVNEV